MSPRMLIGIRARLMMMLSISVVFALAGAAPSDSSKATPKTETLEASDAQGSLERQDNPLRLQGPALDLPQEILDMLNQRQRAVERREEAMRTEETRLLSLKKDIEQLLARQQLLPKTGPSSKKSDAAAKATVDQVVKMYETMPPEEAAVRLEKLPTDMALEVLRLLKGKAAGTILASVRPDKAAKLTELFLAGTPVKKPKPVR